LDLWQKGNLDVFGKLNKLKRMPGKF